LTVPTIEELEREIQITHKDSLTEIPPSQKTIEQFKRYFEKAEGKTFTNEEVKEKMSSDPNPEYYEKKLQLKQIKEEEYIHSDLVKDTARELGIDCE